MLFRIVSYSATRNYKRPLKGHSFSGCKVNFRVRKLASLKPSYRRGEGTEGKIKACKCFCSQAVCRAALNITHSACKVPDFVCEYVSKGPKSQTSTSRT